MGFFDRFNKKNKSSNNTNYGIEQQTPAPAVSETVPDKTDLAVSTEAKTSDVDKNAIVSPDETIISETNIPSTVSAASENKIDNTIDNSESNDSESLVSETADKTEDSVDKTETDNSFDDASASKDGEADKNSDNKTTDDKEDGNNEQTSDLPTASNSETVYLERLPEKRHGKGAPIPMNLSIPSLDSEEDIKRELHNLSIIKTTWKDYCLMMLNSTAEPLRTIWREKIVTSIVHWEFNSGSIGEENLVGLQVLSALPNDFTEKIVDDHFTPGAWHKDGRLTGSKKMKVVLGHYPQESLSNEANLCVKAILKNWDEYNHLIFETPMLNAMWNLAQRSMGQCLLPDELLTYTLEKPVDDSSDIGWIDVCDDIYTNGIPSNKFKKYWRSGKIENYPLAYQDENSAIEGCDENNFFYVQKIAQKDGSVKLIPLTLKEQKENFENLCDIILKENVAWSPCWKKICICILKNDVSMKYAGFSATLRERQARENAMAAFSKKKEERDKAKVEADKLAKRIEAENANK